MQNKQKLLNLLGLARRAGKLVTGEDMVLGAIRNGKASLVFFANDGGASSMKKFTDKTNSYNVPFLALHFLRELARNLNHFVGFDHVTNLLVVVVFNRQTEVVTVLNFLNVILKATQ